MTDHELLMTISEESLENFEAIASAAKKKLDEGTAGGGQGNRTKNLAR